MAWKNQLNGKRLLIVDDELDVLETLADLLTMCDIKKASNYHEAKELLETEYFDIAILDIMGVRGYKLLKIANKRKVPCVMLTAHALSPENVEKSFKEGAASYIPKEKMGNVEALLNEILEAKEKGKSSWWRWLDRWASFFDSKFGPNWQDKDKEFWKNFPTL